MPCSRSYRLYFEVRFVLLAIRRQTLDGIEQLWIRVVEVRIGNVDGCAILTWANVLQTPHGLILAGIVALVLRIVRSIAVGIIGQPEEICRQSILLYTLHILQWNDAAQILVVDVHHIGLGNITRRKEGTLRAGNTRARFLVPVRQMIHAIQRVYVAKLIHALEARLDAGHLRQCAIPRQQQTHLLHGSHVLRIEPVSQAHQRIVVAEYQLVRGHIDEGLKVGGRQYKGYRPGQQVPQLGTKTCKSLHR